MVLAGKFMWLNTYPTRILSSHSCNDISELFEILCPCSIRPPIVIPACPVSRKDLTSIRQPSCRPRAEAQIQRSGLLTSGPGFNSQCRHVRSKFHPGHKRDSPHYRGPCLSIRSCLGESDVKLCHSSIHSSLSSIQWMVFQTYVTDNSTINFMLHLFHHTKHDNRVV